MALSACQSMPNYRGHQGIGTIVGGAGGALLGNQTVGGTAGTVAGGILGATAGYYIAGALNSNEKGSEAKTAFNRAMEYNVRGETTSWKNNWNMDSGAFTPTRSFQRPDGTYCREVLETYRANRKLFQNTVIACRISKENWKVQ